MNDDDDECPFHLRVQAYHDGELDRDADARAAVEAHMAKCPACAAQLRQFWEMSVLFGPLAVSTDDEPTPREIANMHRAVQEDAARNEGSSSLLRLGGMFAGLAASVLIISAAWLAESPGTPAPINRVAPGHTPMARVDDDWQRVASSAQADPRPRVTQQSDSPYATHLADKQMSGWMIFNLDPAGR